MTRIESYLGRSVVLLVCASALAGCATEEEKRVAAETAKLQGAADKWFEGNVARLCPLASSVVWPSPFGASHLEAVAGAGDQFKAVKPLWCLGDAEGESRRLSIVATIPSRGPWALDYDGATIGSVEEVTAGQLLLYWALLPTVIVVALVLVARKWPIHLMATITPFGDLSVFFSYAPLGVLLIAALVLAASIWWTHALFYSGWVYALTPLQIVPAFSMLTRAYLRGLKG